jgi:hypothetical protein
MADWGPAMEGKESRKKPWPRQASPDGFRMPVTRAAGRSHLDFFSEASSRRPLCPHVKHAYYHILLLSYSAGNSDGFRAWLQERGSSPWGLAAGKVFVNVDDGWRIKKSMKDRD